MGMDNFVEEFMVSKQNPQKEQATRKLPANEEATDRMEINAARRLQDLYIDPSEKFMHEHVGTAI